LLLMLLSWPFVYNLIITGQEAILLLPLLSIAFFLQYKNHWLSMTILLALLASLKLFFIIFLLLFIVQRQWRLLLIFVSLFIVFSFLPLLYFGWPMYQAFFHLCQNTWYFISRSMLIQNGSLLGVVTNFFHLSHIKTNFLQIKLLTTVLCLSIITVFLYYDYRLLKRLPRYSNELAFCVLILLGILCSPLGWIYYLVYAFILVVLFFKIAVDYRLPLAFFIAFTLALVLPVFAWHDVTVGIFSIIQHFICFIALLNWLLCIHFVACAIRYPAQSVPNQIKYMLGILIFCALLSIILIVRNFDLQLYLWHKIDLSQPVQSGMWLQRN
jgi:hypothetical protein